jgi:proteasome regulatory subunit
MHLASIDFDEIVGLTEDATGAELEAICREAGMMAVRREATFVEMVDFTDAVHKVKNEIVTDNRMYT